MKTKYLQKSFSMSEKLFILVLYTIVEPFKRVKICQKHRTEN